MKVSLRKAKALQTSIQDIIKELDHSDTVNISIFQSPSMELAKASRKFDADMSRHLNLLSALYAIRGAVGKANAESGIDMALTASALINKSLEVKERFTKATTRFDDAVLEGKLSKLGNGQKESMYAQHMDSITAPILTKQQIDSIKLDVASLKKKKQQLADSILELNIRTEITLSDDVIGVLKEENLI